MSLDTDVFAPEGIVPKLRTDLEHSSLDKGHKTVVIKDRSNARYYYMREEELSLLQLCDGHRSVSKIHACFIEQSGKYIEIDSIREFLRRIEVAGLLQSQRHQGEQKVPENSSRIRSKSVLYWRIKAIDPDRFLGRLVPITNKLFTPYFGCLCALIVTAAISMLIRHHGEFSNSLQSGGLAVFLVTLLISFGICVIHELSHGLACKHWGGEVHELGFLLIYFNPALYCNVTDAWLFPRKRHRVFTMAAGTACDALVGAFFVFSWWLTMQFEFINTVFAMVVLIIELKILANLNPLIRLDGYYVLSDILGLPNLRKRAFHFTWSTISPRLKVDAKDAHLPVSTKFTLFLYAVLAAPFSVLFLVWTLHRIAWVVVGSAGLIDWAVTAILALIVFRVQVVKAMGELRAWLTGTSRIQ
ncbi:MAG: hypothetical protein OXN96_01260 [Bryobacterales bacterium]|nr:hypothetical protein [Bryobacterales bacterium]